MAQFRGVFTSFVVFPQSSAVLSSNRKNSMYWHMISEGSEIAYFLYQLVLMSGGSLLNLPLSSPPSGIGAFLLISSRLPSKRVVLMGVPGMNEIVEHPVFGRVPRVVVFRFEQSWDAWKQVRDKIDVLENQLKGLRVTETALGGLLRESELELGRWANDAQVDE